MDSASHADQHGRHQSHPDFNSLFSGSNQTQTGVTQPHTMPAAPQQQQQGSVFPFTPQHPFSQQTTATSNHDNNTPGPGPGPGSDASGPLAESGASALDIDFLDNLNNLLAMQGLDNPQSPMVASPALNPQAIMEQQFKLNQLQHLQQLQSQILQQQLKLITGHDGASSMLPGPMTDSAMPMGRGMRDLSSSSTPTTELVSPSTTGYLSPGSLNMMGTHSHYHNHNHNHAQGHHHHHPQHSHQQHPHPHQQQQHTYLNHPIHPHYSHTHSQNHSGNAPYLPDRACTSAPAHIVFRSPISSAQSDNFDVSPLTSPWLGAETPGLTPGSSSASSSVSHSHSGHSGAMGSSQMPGSASMHGGGHQHLNQVNQLGSGSGGGGRSSMNKRPASPGGETASRKRQSPAIGPTDPSGIFGITPLAMTSAPSATSATSVSSSSAGSTSTSTSTSTNPKRPSMGRESRSTNSTPLLKGTNQMQHKRMSFSSASASGTGKGTPTFGASGSKNPSPYPASGAGMSMEVVGDSPSPVDLSMPPPAQPAQSSSSSRGRVGAGVGAGAGGGGSGNVGSHLIPVTPASIMNIDRLGLGVFAHRAGEHSAIGSSHSNLNHSNNISSNNNTGTSSSGSSQHGLDDSAYPTNVSTSTSTITTGPSAVDTANPPSSSYEYENGSASGAGLGTVVALPDAPAGMVLDAPASRTRRRAGSKVVPASAAGAVGSSSGGASGSAAEGSGASARTTRGAKKGAAKNTAPPPTQPPTQVEPQRKVNHKDAEKKRRDNMKTIFDELRHLLPPIPLPTDPSYSTNTNTNPNNNPYDPDDPPPPKISVLPGALPPRGPPKAGVEGPNKGVSKLQLLLCGNEYIRVMKGRVERRDEEIERLRGEVRRLRGVLSMGMCGGGEEGGEEFEVERDVDRDEVPSMELAGRVVMEDQEDG